MAISKVALLSNINTDPINRILNSKEFGFEVYRPQGYGNELGILLNKGSSLCAFKPDIVFLIIDIMELIDHALEIEKAKIKIDEWFKMFESSLQEDIIYYISDGYLSGLELDVVWDKSIKRDIELIWIENLKDLMEKNKNTRCFFYSRLVERIGENSGFSEKMWYMGKIPYSVEMQKAIAEEISHKTQIEGRTPKKVLLLDLDNTLWRGLAGEDDITPIVLSEEGAGLSYKNFQRAIKEMQSQGVILCIVSKNNEEDGMKIIKNHPHMVLREKDFAAFRINWKNKNENIVEIADELNIGLDDMVFIDDDPKQRALIKDSLSQVIVPDFPARPEDLTAFISKVYRDYFEKPVLTQEDRDKTLQYHAKSQRKKMQETAIDFDAYLESLEIKLIRTAPEKHKERMIQLVNKTNQFNLTTRRLTEREAAGIFADEKSEIFLYAVRDKFGDHGIVAVAIVTYGENVEITEFTMSCRVMGLKIENAIIEDVERAAKKKGYKRLIGVYKPTGKNKPVENLYPSLGYKNFSLQEGESTKYFVDLEGNLERKYHLDRAEEN